MWVLLSEFDKETQIDHRLTRFGVWPFQPTISLYFPIVNFRCCHLLATQNKLTHTYTARRVSELYVKLFVNKSLIIVNQMMTCVDMISKRKEQHNTLSYIEWVMSIVRFPFQCRPRFQTKHGVNGCEWKLGKGNVFTWKTSRVGCRVGHTIAPCNWMSALSHFVLWTVRWAYLKNA